MREKITLLKSFIMQNSKALGLACFLMLLVLLGFIFSSPYRGGNMEISTYSPKPGGTEFPTNGSVDIIFKNNISVETQQAIYTRFVPGIPYTKEWVSPTQLRLTPQVLLNNDSEYKVEVTYSKNIIGSTNFRTAKAKSTTLVPLKEVTKEEVALLHEDADVVNKSIEALKSDHPWYFNLPIITDKYAIIYNNKKDQFRISIYSKGMSEKEKEETLAKAVDRLRVVVSEDAIRLGYYVIYRDDYNPNGGQ